MPCISPIKLRNPLFNNKDPAAMQGHIKKVRGSFKHLSEMVNGIDQWVYVPCGKCYGCMRMRCNAWVFRHLMELENATSSHFVTFTYNSENLPFTENGNLCFKKDDVQKFWKRLRKKLSEVYPDVRVKYHIAAEYGDKFGRPHYHALLYGYPNEPEMLDLIPQIWGKGNVQIGNITEASIRYVVEYITQYYYEEEFETEEEKPFAMFSNSLGSQQYRVVADYITNSLVNLYPINGKMMRVPNSYLNALRDKGYITPRVYEKIKTNAYEYYEEKKRDNENSSVSRGISPFADEITRIRQQSVKHKRKYRLRKNGVIN